MDKSKQSLKNLFSNAKTLGKMNPIFHWNVLLVVTCIVFCLFVFFNLFLFYKVKNQTLFEEQIFDSAPQVMIKSKLLKDIEISFKQKENSTKNLIEKPLNYNDPSF